MPNITVLVSQEAYTNARVFAARRNTSISAIVRLCLENIEHLRFNPGAAQTVARNHAAAKAAAGERQQAARAARMAALLAPKSSKSTENG